MRKDTPILIVDDYRTMLRIVRTLLHHLGFTDVDEATDGAGALAMLERRRYGLIIADWAMAPMGGLDLLRRVRAEGPNADVPFVMVTARDTEERMRAAEAEGASGCIAKPFDAATLRTTLAQVLGA